MGGGKHTSLPLPSVLRGGKCYLQGLRTYLSTLLINKMLLEVFILKFMKKVKVKVPLDNFCPVVSDSRGRCSAPFPSHRASVLSEDNLPWSHGQCDLDTECCYLPTEVVPINLLAFACFRTAI